MKDAAAPVSGRIEDGRLLGDLLEQSPSGENSITMVQPWTLCLTVGSRDGKGREQEGKNVKGWTL